MIAPDHHLALLGIAGAFRDRPIVVIGAAAFAWHFGPSFRGTLDLDLGIAIDLAEHARAAGLPATWQRVARMPHRWRLPNGQLVDILPASDSLLAIGSVTFADGTTLSLTGIDLAMQDAVRCGDDLPATVRVATRRALFVTKVAAWLDRPGDRLKDLGDTCLLLDRYVELDDPRLFDDPALEPQREFDERPAFLLGVDLRAVCADRHLQRIREFVARVGDPERSEHHWMTKAAPTGWQHDESALARRLDALCTGLGMTR